MNRQTKIILIASLVLAAALMLYFFRGKETLDNRRPSFVSADWKSKFKSEEKTPYGLFLFYEMLKAHVDTTHSIDKASNTKELDSLLKKPVTMVFIGDEFGLQNEEIDTVLSSVKKGSVLFLSFNSLTSNIYERLFAKVDIRYDYADSVNVFVGNKKLTQYELFQNDTIAHQWAAFYEVIPKDSVYTSLSSFMEMSNFIRIPHGKGAILLQTNPNFFYNYQLKRNDGYEYSAYVIERLPKNKDVVDLELGRLLDEKNQEILPETVEGDQGKRDDSYLQFLLTSPAFIAAMALTVFGLFLFLIFRARRLRPIVPYIEPKKNVTMEFAETITSIYLSKQYPYSVLQLQKKNFHDTIYKNYYVDLARNPENRERELYILSEKSNYDLNELKELLKLLETKVWAQVDDNYLVTISKKMRAFYEKTGIISHRVMEKIKVLESKFQRELLLSVGSILAGITIICTGFYFLVQSTGIGILLWPLGLAFLVFGSIRLSKPMLTVDKNHLIFYPILGKKRIYKLNEIYRIEKHTNSVDLYFNGDKTLTINYWEMSSFDKKQFEQFISQKH